MRAKTTSTNRTILCLSNAQTVGRVNGLEGEKIRRSTFKVRDAPFKRSGGGQKDKKKIKLRQNFYLAENLEREVNFGSGNE